MTVCRKALACRLDQTGTGGDDLDDGVTPASGFLLSVASLESLTFIYTAREPISKNTYWIGHIVPRESSQLFRGVARDVFSYLRE